MNWLHTYTFLRLLKVLERRLKFLTYQFCLVCRKKLVFNKMKLFLVSLILIIIIIRINLFKFCSYKYWNTILKIFFQVVLICIAAALAAPSPEPKPAEKSESDSTLHLQKRQAGPSPKPYSDALAYFNNYGSWPSGYTQHYALLNYNGLNPVFFNPNYRL